MPEIIFMGSVSLLCRMGCLPGVTFQSPRVVDLPRLMLGAICNGDDLDIFLFFVKEMMARSEDVHLRCGSIVSFLGTG